MAKNKDRADMLFRGVLVEVRSEINDFCKEHDLKLRDFLELAINTLKKKQPQDEQGPKVLAVEQTVRQMGRRIKLYEEVTKVQAKIREIEHPLALSESGLDASIREKMLADLQDMKAKLIEKMDSLLPDGNVEDAFVRASLSQTEPDRVETNLENLKGRFRETTGLDLDSYLKEFGSNAEVVEEENSSENPIDAFLRSDQEKAGPMVFGEKATPERKAEVERIGGELEKRKKKKSSR